MGYTLIPISRLSHSRGYHVMGLNVTKDLFDNTNIRHDKVLAVLEKVRTRFDKSAIKLVSINLSNAWKM
jgi:hypothetical protein